MDKVNKQELRRLAEAAKDLDWAFDWMDKRAHALRNEANPAAILSLLDELEENDGVIAVWRGRLQRAEAELEQYRKDAERYRWLKDSGHFRTVTLDMGGNHSWLGMGRHIGKGRTIEEAIDTEMAKEGGANG